MNIIVIGEMASKLSAEFIKNYNAIPWKKIIGLRNIIAHHYFGVSIETIWEITATDIPELLKYLKEILKDSGL